MDSVQNTIEQMEATAINHATERRAASGIASPTEGWSRSECGNFSVTMVPVATWRAGSPSGHHRAEYRIAGKRVKREVFQAALEAR